MSKDILITMFILNDYHIAIEVFVDVTSKTRELLEMAGQMKENND